MNLQSVLQEFNPSKFIVYNCLLAFTILLALRLDGTIQISYWLVFTPLFIWKSLAIFGALIGTIVWCRNPIYRLSDSSYIHFKSMLISLSLQLLLLMFELLCCDKLESGRHYWIMAFIPLIFISLLSIAICIWAMKNDRGYEMELFCSINIIQFIFIALRLDRFITWSWMVVFVPLWFVMCLSIIGVLYALIFSAILLRTPEVSVEQRKASLRSSIANALVVLPMLLFLVLLCNKLDSSSLMPSFLPFQSIISSSTTDSPTLSIQELNYFRVCLPLYFSLVILIGLSFGSKGGNAWWFGMRKDFCSFILSAMPCLREYGNISYSKHSSSQTNSVNTNLDLTGVGDGNLNRPTILVTASSTSALTLSCSKDKTTQSVYQPTKKPVVPQMTIESPD